jgi:heterodisulfide reductase subunit A-like polyferredoxin
MTSELIERRSEGVEGIVDGEANVDRVSVDLAQHSGQVGAVLVVGAGIGGMQASLDLAEAGLKVYLLDKSPAIGGVMAQLDKTFPTNDCAMCILAPKLVECGRHRNIEVLTYAELDGIDGEPGNFTVRVRQHPRYVNVDDCTGCGDCADVCPIQRPDQFNVGLSERRAIYKLYPQAIPNAYVIDKQGTAPCRDACPAGQRAQGYIALINEGRYEDAMRVIKEDNPFPAICGRICNRRCEEACSRGKWDDPVNIRALKRFVTDTIYAQPRVAPEPVERKYEQRVAVIGAGPCGLTAAQDLCRMGYGVDVFEALPVAGGMLRVGVPEYRLPADVIDREVQDIVDLGVNLHLNARVDDLDALFEQGFDAGLIAMGAHEGIRLPIPGADLDGVMINTTFLRDVRLSQCDGDHSAPELGEKVAVIGAGDVAMDVARTAVRIGAETHIFYRRTPEEAPADAEELRHAQEEGVIFHWQTNPIEVVAGEDGRMKGLKLVRTEQGPPDSSGRRRPVPIADSEFFAVCDNVIFSVGQHAGLDFISEETAVEVTRWNTVAADEQTCASSRQGVFAAGDAVTGTAFVIDAIAAGHRAAESIHDYLQNGTFAAPTEREESRDDDSFSVTERGGQVVDLSSEEVAARMARGDAAAHPRTPLDTAPMEERLSTFGEVVGGYTEEQARAEAARCLACGICSECLQCVYACQKDCIDHEMGEELIDLQVGAVILTLGLDTVDGDIRPEFGYGRLDNVVTSIEFERMLSASGPWGGVVQRPSDGAHPRKVAFIQCVGSRDPACDQGYCSAVCCMYATKEALIAKEHDPNVEPTIFYMDVRSFGKDFDRYVDRAENENGVRFVRSMVSMVTEAPGTGDLRVRYATDDGDNVEETFDLLVLSVGLRPPEGSRALADRLGIALNEYGFARTPTYLPAQTVRPSGSLADGLFVAGPFSEPKDIPETVIEASCAAAQASALLADARGSMVEETIYPPERDVSEEEPRVGVFVCHCGINIGGVVDVPAVVEYISRLPDVVHVEDNLYTCSQDTQERIREQIEAHDLNRVVVASCTPRTHEPLFQETLRSAGLNRHLFQMTNIREQVSWVHRADPQAATDKAKDLTKMAVAKARNLQPIPHQTFEVNHHAVVIGGGLAGMTAALSIARQGFSVTLVEREETLGGNLQHIYTPLPDGADPQTLLQQTIAAISANPRISVRTGAEIVDVSGYVGQYRTSIRKVDKQSDVGGGGNGHVEEGYAEQSIEHGVIVVATGAQEIEPQAYLYGEDERVITQRELERMLAQSPNDPIIQSLNAIVMIQCVGSRDDEHPYCSRICCTEAIKNALAIKARNPETDVYILYRDIRTFGFKEQYYRDARRAGVVFLQYDAEEKPEVRSGEDRLAVDVWVQPEGERFTLGADLLVLSAGIEPRADNDALAKLLKTPLTEDGFFLEAHVKLRPLDFAADGVYLCGMAHSPRFLDETIAQAQGAAMRAVALLSKEELEATPITAWVDPLLCSNCGQCIEVCPYDARIVLETPSLPLPLAVQGGTTRAYVQVIDVLCQGCGACVSVCPNKASQQKGFEMTQIHWMLDVVTAE